MLIGASEKIRGASSSHAVGGGTVGTCDCDYTLCQSHRIVPDAMAERVDQRMQWSWRFVRHAIVIEDYQRPGVLQRIGRVRSMGAVRSMGTEYVKQALERIVIALFVDEKEAGLASPFRSREVVPVGLAAGL
jgi:hypothetical protein